MSFITSPGVIVPPLTAGGVAYGTGSQAKMNNAGTAGQPVVSGGAGAPEFRPYTLPASDGSANQVLQTNGLGALSFATPSSGPAAGLAKAWLKCNVVGVIAVSHNITSITDTGVGVVTVTIATDFSSADYVVTVTPGRTERLVGASITNAGVFVATSDNTSAVPADPTNWFITCFGDQA